MNIKIGNYYLDNNQMKIVKDNSKYLLVTAGAGSGKTSTILGKIKYLINEKGIKPDEILCISFTKKAASNLEDKIKEELNILVPTYTFHKLSLEILKNNNVFYDIASNDLLDDIINSYFYLEIYNYPYQQKLVLDYFNIKDYKKINHEKIIILSKNISTFIHFFKSNNYKIDDYKIFFNKIKYTLSLKRYKHEKNFLLISLNIYLMYRKYLKENNEIDFDDMLIEATKLINEKGYNKKIKYIIIDEYQDTSLIRFNLIYAMLKDTNSNLMVVGDDFQSIYKFTGCDINLFLNFNNYFKDAKILKIENTYRNSQQLINISGNFIMKNKKQIRKKLISNKNINKPIIIIYYKNIKTTFKKTIEKIYDDFKEEILILGRNNNDINLILDNDFKLNEERLIYLKNRNIKLKYLTVHKSKGLEESNVIIINLIDTILGFPSKIKEDKILRLVIKKEKYLYSEERRLFYVALTRTKNYVYLLIPKKNISCFAREIINDYRKNIQIIRR